MHIREFLLGLDRAVKLHVVMAEMLRNGMFCAVLANILNRLEIT